MVNAPVPEASQVTMAFEAGTPREVIAFRDISFQLNQGEILAIVGPSGCGKSTLFNVIAGLLRPTFDGWKMIPEGLRVYIDDFVPEGDVLVPGVVRADAGIRDGDEVLVLGPRAMATGKAALPSEEMTRSRKGVAVRVRKIKRLEPK